MQSRDQISQSGSQAQRLSTGLAILTGGAILAGAVAVGVLLYWPTSTPVEVTPSSTATLYSDHPVTDSPSPPTESGESGESGEASPAPTGGQLPDIDGPFAVTGDEDATHGWPPMYPEGTPVPAATVQTRTPASAEDLAALATAHAFAQAFVRAPSDQERPWYEGIRPYLSPQARSDYLDTDPSTVWYTEVTGSGSLVVLPGEEQAHFVSVLIATDGGPSLVGLMPDERYPSGWAVRSFSSPQDQP